MAAPRVDFLNRRIPPKVFGYWKQEGDAADDPIDWPVRPHHGCHEIDGCRVPWWIVALFIAGIIGPAVVYASIAYVGMGRRWSPGRWAAVSLVVFLVTGGLYVAWFACRAFL